MTSSALSIGTLIGIFFFITSSNSINFYDVAYAQQADLKDPDILFLTINGLILGLGVIVGITFGTRKLSKRLPLRVLFGLTMGLGAYVSIALLGNAVKEFQEVGYISATPTFSILPQLDINLAIITGIHPTLETITGQLILLSIYIADSIYVLILRPRQKKDLERSKVNGKL
jgi:high-affinity Fe2+/Pb2+ permease